MNNRNIAPRMQITNCAVKVGREREQEREREIGSRRISLSPAHLLVLIHDSSELHSPTGEAEQRSNK